MGHEPEGYTEDDLHGRQHALLGLLQAKPYISREPEKGSGLYLKMAKAFLKRRTRTRPDTGSAKLAMYFFCIAGQRLMWRILQAAIPDA